MRDHCGEKGSMASATEAVPCKGIGPSGLGITQIIMFREVALDRGRQSWRADGEKRTRNVCACIYVTWFLVCVFRSCLFAVLLFRVVFCARCLS